MTTALRSGDVESPVLVWSLPAEGRESEGKLVDLPAEGRESDYLLRCRGEGKLSVLELDTAQLGNSHGGLARV
jgi:hypothetical protein